MRNLYYLLEKTSVNCDIEFGLLPPLTFFLFIIYLTVVESELIKVLESV